MQYCPNGTFSYVINYGDTLWILAKRFNTTIEAIILANPGIDTNNIYVGQHICIPVNNGLFNNNFMNQLRINNEILDLNNLLRQTFLDNVIYTRFVILGILYNLPDLNYTYSRLFKNSFDFVVIFKPLYPDDKTSQFKLLLDNHYKLVIELIKATKAGIDYNHIEKKCEENADEVSKLLAELNPKWEEATWQKMLYEHLNITKQEVNFYLKNDYNNGVLIFDKKCRQALMMSDEMTNGIIKQFPNKYYKEKKN